MKKTLIDLSYYTFSSNSSQKIINTCYSTVGYLSLMTTKYNVFFLVRSKFDFDLSELNNLKIRFYKGQPLKKWQIPFLYNYYVRSFNPDYILVHGFGYIHYLVILKLLLPKTKIILQCNGYANKPKGLKKWIYIFSDNFIDGYLFTGLENAREWYDSNVLKRDKIFEMMEGSTNFKYDSKIQRKKYSYLWVGNLIKRKDPLTILKAFEDFIYVQPLATLTMVFRETDLLLEVSEFLSKDEKLKKSVQLVGMVDHKLLERVYNSHQFFVLGSKSEGSGYALVEAMSCGCVPIVTNIAPFRYMTNEGECAFLFTPENDSELLLAFKKSQNCNFELQQKKVLIQFKQKLSFEAIAKKVESIFQNL